LIAKEAAHEDKTIFLLKVYVTCDYISCLLIQDRIVQSIGIMKTTLCIIMQNHSTKRNCYELGDNGDRLSSVDNTLMDTVILCQV